MLSALFRSSAASSGSVESETERAPFVLERRSLELKSDGTFVPEAAVLLTPALLESGLLLRLTPTELQTLLLVLCGVTSNGNFVATSESLAAALHLWPGQMRARLERLVSRQWKGEPLLRCQTTATGLRLFAPSPALLTVRYSLVFPATERGGVPLEPPAIVQSPGTNVTGGLREAVVEHSRATYGRPRAEVEAEIHQFLASGKNARAEKNLAATRSRPTSEVTVAEETEPPTPEEAAKRELARQLSAVGLSVEQARHMVEVFPSEVIERQLAYLPYRQARSPVGMLVASIEGDYAPPLAARHATTADASTPALTTEGSVLDANESRVAPVQTDGSERAGRSEQGETVLPPLQSLSVIPTGIEEAVSPERDDSQAIH